MLNVEVINWPRSDSSVPQVQSLPPVAGDAVQETSLTITPAPAIGRATHTGRPEPLDAEAEQTLKRHRSAVSQRPGKNLTIGHCTPHVSCNSDCIYLAHPTYTPKCSHVCASSISAMANPSLQHPCALAPGSISLEPACLPISQSIKHLRITCNPSQLPHPASYQPNSAGSGDLIIHFPDTGPIPHMISYKRPGPQAHPPLPTPMSKWQNATFTTGPLPSSEQLRTPTHQVNPNQVGIPATTRRWAPHGLQQISIVISHIANDNALDLLVNHFKLWAAIVTKWLVTLLVQATACALHNDLEHQFPAQRAQWRSIQHGHRWLHNSSKLSA